MLDFGSRRRRGCRTARHLARRRVREHDEGDSRRTDAPAHGHSQSTAAAISADGTVFPPPYSDGEEFDASWHQQSPFTFVLGAGQVIEGWDKGLRGIKVGGRREFAIPAAQAYGAAGKRAIPPNEPLVFLVDLLAVKAAH
ncbi:FKBP-type peptidyl-prolyl cis-trans isomerase [Sphaerisporangium viridialbum]|uniref:FKBP-type peptidyl-prolyl cis-trans isomerase n=1 Tax=Sphaerisporangium viridialbum TaxID=46189 RepID=UPI003C77FA98